MPEVLQQARSECGAACIAMVAGWWGHGVSLDTLRRIAGSGSRGIGLTSLVELAGHAGLSARPLQLGLQDMNRLFLPAILHWQMNHFVVLARVKRKRVLVHDPAAGRRWISLDEVDKSFTGVALELRPREGRLSGGDRRESGLRDIFRGIEDIRKYLALLSVVVVASQFLSLAPAIATQLLIDELVLGQAGHWLTAVLVALAAALACGISIDALRSWIALYSGTQLAIDSTRNVVSRLLRMPVEFVQSRSLGDTMSRLESLVPLRRAVTEQAVDTLGNLTLLVATLVIMLIYDTGLALISVAGFVGAVIVLVSVLPGERRLAEQALAQRAAEKNSLIETLRGYDTVRSLGMDGVRDSHWQNRFFDATDSTYRAGRLAILRSTLTAFVTAVEQLLFIAVGISAAIDQKVSIGALFAFMSLRGRFSTAAMQLLRDTHQFGLLRVHIRRLADLVSAAPTPAPSHGAVCRRINGALEVSGVEFGYAAGHALFRQLSFAINAGAHVVITGPTGCGKTTLLRILAGQLQPRAGTVSLDGLELSLWNRIAFTRQIGMVMQNEHLFQGTIAENIAAFDPEIDLARVRAAADKAEIWVDVKGMPMGTQSMLGDTGTDLSGGQVQRLALARAIYRRPRILFLDEATSHLDVDTEQQVLRNIRRLGITTISVAHRPAAVDEASQVIRLEPAVTGSRNR